MKHITPQEKDFSEWYLDVIKVAELADYSKVKGCMIIKPYGYAIWEFLQKDLDARIKTMGVKNVYFPLLIPESLLHKEKEHVEGFSPEVAVVTHAGGKKLDEPLVLRPTSETIMYDTFSEWVQSYRDLPLLLNQWANVIRWEMRTRPFLRTTEFLWQEGHTVHKTSEEAGIFTMKALEMYKNFARDVLNIATLSGKKSEKEKFAGALYTLAIETLAKDGKAIQAGTSHHLGDNFARAFHIQYLDANNEKQYAWQTSWGVSTRLIGAIIVAHGDNKGLRLPPALAPIQVVIVPIFKTDEEKKVVFKKAQDLVERVKDFVRVEIDFREEMSPGSKFYEWEAKGVPIRVEIGPKEVASDSLVVVRRNTGIKLNDSFENFVDEVPEYLRSIGEEMYKESEKHLKENTREVEDYKEFQKILREKNGFLKVYWAGGTEDENRIQDETKSTIRILESYSGKEICFYTKKSATHIAYFAKAY